jgi:hypothetical protein
MPIGRIGFAALDKWLAPSRVLSKFHASLIHRHLHQKYAHIAHLLGGTIALQMHLFKIQAKKEPGCPGSVARLTWGEMRRDQL